MTSGTTSCPFCGAQVTAGNRFCTSCGKPMDKPRFCGQCGAQLEATARFCGKCGGQAVSPWDASAQTSPAARSGVGGEAPTAPDAAPAAAAGAVSQPVASSEPVIGVIIGAQRRKGLLGYQLFNIVVTRDRLVFAQVTDKMQKDAAQELHARAKSEGKGLLGRVAAQFGHLNLTAQRHAAMPLAALLSENKDNFFIANNTISKARIEEHYDSEDGTSETKLKIESISGKFEFKLRDGDADQARQTLRHAVGAAVR